MPLPPLIARHLRRSPPPPVFSPDYPPRAAIIAVAPPLNAAAIAGHDMKSSIFCFSEDEGLQPV
jgi:hypothetical protein